MTAGATTQHKVAVFEPFDQAAMDLLRSVATVVEPEDPSMEAKVRCLADADAVIVRTIPLPAAIIESGRRLRVIGRHGVGVDNIDLEAAKRRGIAVVSTPGANSVAVAEFTVALILALVRRVGEASEALRGGAFSSGGSLPAQVQLHGLMGRELSSMSAGIVGYGAIGGGVARLLTNLGIGCTVYDPYMEVDEPDLAVVPSLEDLLPNVDILTLHAPLTATTRGLIGERELKALRKGAYLVNTARAELVDRNALVGALEKGHLAGAALDVWWNEPPESDSESLLSMSNVIPTPHMAAMTEESLAKMGRDVVVKVLEALDDLSGK